MAKHGLYRPMAREPWHLQMAPTASGDPTGRSSVNKRDIITLQVDKETGFLRAVLDSNTGLQNVVGSGLEGVSKGLTSNATSITNSIVSNSQNNTSNKGLRGGDSDLDLVSIISGNLT